MQLSRVILALSFVVFASAAALPDHSPSDPQDGINPIGNGDVHIVGRSPVKMADLDGYKCKGSPNTCKKKKKKGGKMSKKQKKYKKKLRKQKKKQEKKKQKLEGNPEETTEPPVTDPSVDPPVDPVDPAANPPVNPVDPPPPAATGVDTPPV